MSGLSDTSTPQQRALFCQLIEDGAPKTGLPAAAAAVANSPAIVPDTTAGLLDLPFPSTYAQASARVLFKLQNSPSSL